MRNVRHRLIAAPAAQVWSVVSGLAGPDDAVWPAADWPRLVMDRGLAVGSRGGHGPIRYRCVRHEPGRLLRFDFAPTTGLHGHHTLTVAAVGPDHCRLAVVVDARLHDRMRILWPTMVRWLHEALMEDLFDNIERAATGGLHGAPAQWTRWVRLVRRLRGATPVRRVTPAAVRRTGQ
ncbi:MAG TPA: SRPBCC family protein [Pilimelia sp.]|nr:SRPBCC family protein [Pilimelia sp.]